jgi:uncharacterized membrane protein
MTFLHELLSTITDVSILIFEYIGVFVIVFSGIVGIISYIRKDPLTRLKLAKGLAMGLEFKLGSEILRTVVLREIGEILIVGSIIVLRAALTFLIHWEIKNEESTHEKERNAMAEQEAKRKS